MLTVKHIPPVPHEEMPPEIVQAPGSFDLTAVALATNSSSGSKEEHALDISGPHKDPKPKNNELPVSTESSIKHEKGLPTDSTEKRVSEDVQPDSEDQPARPSATLYCPKTKRLHSHLLDFGIVTCPSCSQDLTDQSSPEDGQTESEGSDDEDTEGQEEGEKDKVNDISYRMAYRDSDNDVFHDEESSVPFDLSKPTEHGAGPIIAVTTNLNTSIHYRNYDEIERAKTEGVLGHSRYEPRVSGTVMDLYSPEFRRVLGKLMGYYPDANLLRINEPFAELGHHLSEIEAYGSMFEATTTPSNHDDPSIPQLSTLHKQLGPCDQVTHRHIGLIFEFLKQFSLLDQLEAEKARHQQEVPCCTFRMLWLLFKPGTTVYTEADGRLSAFVVRSVFDQLQPYKIRLWALDFDGHFVRRRRRVAYLPRFEGERPVTSLAVIPSTFLDQKDGGYTRDLLIRHGREWYGLLKGKQIDGRVVVDSSSCIRLHSESERFHKWNEQTPDFNVEDYGTGLVTCSCDRCHNLRPHPSMDFPWADYDIIDPKKEASLELHGDAVQEDHRYLLCPRHIYGFVLKTRSWQRLDIACVSPARLNPHSIERLVMDEDRKTMIKSMIRSYAAPSGINQGHSNGWSADHVENKGEGKIFLLHGGPGVGKTYCIADYTKRPLLSLTSADIGTSASEIETHLSKWFQLGEDWGAVILLDEADIFLERRQVSDIERNSFVAVFLRCMEYYKGILFLTTNRVGTFDDAFISRIHVIIHYASLGEPERRKIWEQFFDKLTRERKDIHVSWKTKKYVLNGSEITGLRWNGREIRNAFQTAVALAEYRHSEAQPDEAGEKIELESDDFERVCAMTKDFKTYLKNVHGADEDGRAFKDRARSD
ncbi:ATPase [Xylariomycetidae sp. FL0641]|nr:ATPase [Xylariomycetidae sp. FL0641]